MKAIKNGTVDVWKDENGNTWNASKYTREQALEHSESLKGCTNCHNCMNCEGCTGCVDCFACINCTNCTSCGYSENCVDCQACAESTNCSNCLFVKGGYELASHSGL